MRIIPTSIPGAVARRLLQGAGWALLAAVAARGGALVGAVLAGRLLGTRGFGELAMLQSTAELATVLGNFGLGLTATRFVAAHRARPERAGRYAGVAILGTLVTGSLVSAAFWAMAPAVAHGLLGAPELGRPLRLACGAVLFGSLNTSLLGALAGLEAFRTLAWLAVARGAGGALFLVAGLLIGNLEGAILGWTAAEAVVTALSLGAVKGRFAIHGIRVRFRGLGGEWPVLWRFGFPALMAGLATVPAIWAARILLVRQEGGYAALGVFTAAQKWGSAVLFVPAAIGSIVLPILADSFGRDEMGTFRQVFRTNLVAGAALAVIPALLVAAFASPLMSSYGRDYASGGLVLVILALAAAPTTLNTLLGQALVSAGRIWWRLAFDLLLAATLLSLGWWLIPRLGASGLASAYAGAFLVTTLALGAFLRYRFPTRARGRAGRRGWTSAAGEAGEPGRGLLDWITAAGAAE